MHFEHKTDIWLCIFFWGFRTVWFIFFRNSDSVVLSVGSGMSLFPHPHFFRILDKQNDMDALAAELKRLEASYRNLEATNQVCAQVTVNILI